MIDADRHVSEPLSVWHNYLPKTFKDYIPYHAKGRYVVGSDCSSEEPTTIVQLLPELYIQDKPLFNNWGNAVQLQATKESQHYQDNMKKGVSPQDQILSMNDSGITQAYLFPTITAYIVSNQNLPAEVSAGFAYAYNNWLRDYCSISPTRLLAVGLVSKHDPKMMLDELDRILSFGWHNVVLYPEMIHGRSLGHPDYAPFWSRCESDAYSRWYRLV